jgi:small subunit ribosomal protein S6
MSNRVYESAVLINAALEDEQIQSIISHIKEIIINSGGEIQDVEDWGRKRLAYMVKKSKIGYYAIFRFNAPPNIITKLERYYKLDESILRFLTISLSSNALEQIEKNRTKSETETDTKTEAEVKEVEDIVLIETEENFDKPSEETAINS